VHGSAPGEVPADQLDPSGNPMRHLTAEQEEDMDKRHQEATLQVRVCAASLLVTCVVWCSNYCLTDACP
jgi:hypothetical protein